MYKQSSINTVAVHIFQYRNLSTLLSQSKGQSEIMNDVFIVTYGSEGQAYE